MGNVIPVLINTDRMHELQGDQLIDDIKDLCHGRSLPTSFLRESYYGAGRDAGRAVSGHNGAKVGVYHHSSESHVFMTEHTNLFDMSPTYADWRAEEDLATAERELARIKTARKALAEAEKRVKARIAQHKAAAVAESAQAA